MRKKSHLLTTAGVLALTACGGSSVNEPLVCTDIFVMGLRVEVVDSTSGAAIEEGISGRAVEGEYSEEMERWQNVLSGAGERAGLYSVTIDADGYETWSRDDILVTADQCHVNTVELRAEMTRENQG